MKAAAIISIRPAIGNTAMRSQNDVGVFPARRLPFPMDPTLRDALFESGLESPGSWLVEARSLKVAADRLDPIAAPVAEQEDTLTLYPQYCMLLGMSFELLLKGIIMAARLGAGHAEGLPKRLQGGHDLATLASDPDCALAAIAASELELLSNLSPFILWMGRYPLPKKPEAYEVRGYGSAQRAPEQELWGRLSQILKEHGWVMKGGSAARGGHKLMTRGQQ